MPPDKYTPEAMKAIMDYIIASDRNAKEPDETWSEGFQAVLRALDRLHIYFSKAEVSAIMVNSAEIRGVLTDSGLIERRESHDAP